MEKHTKKVVSGVVFKELITEAGWALVKYFSNDFSRLQQEHREFHYNFYHNPNSKFHFKFGLNQIPKAEVDLDPENKSSSGGFYFTYIESYKWSERHWFAVTVPDDAQVLVGSNDKFKTDKLIILEEIHPTEVMYLKVVEKFGSSLMDIEKQTDVICLAAVRQHGDILAYVKNQTEAICMAAVQAHASAFEHVKIQTDAICMAAVQNEGWILQFVENQTEAICIAAVQQGNYLKFVKKQTEAICLEAVRISPMALKYVENQTDAICVAAVQNIKSALRYVKNQTEAIYDCVRDQSESLSCSNETSVKSVKNNKCLIFDK